MNKLRWLNDASMYLFCKYTANDETVLRLLSVRNETWNDTNSSTRSYDFFIIIIIVTVKVHETARSLSANIFISKIWSRILHENIVTLYSIRLAEAVFRYNIVRSERGVFERK